MLKTTNEGLTRSGTGCFKLYHMATDSGRQRVKLQPILKGHGHNCERGVSPSGGWKWDDQARLSYQHGAQPLLHPLIPPRSTPCYVVFMYYA